MNLFNLLLAMAANVKEISTFVKLARELKGTPRRLLQALVNKPQEFAEMLGKLDKSTRIKISKTMQAKMENKEEFAFLSSSWIVSGHYKPTTAFTGELTITTKQGGSYTYPGVPNQTWTAMKLAHGKNGSGAGSVFWNTYLRGFKGTFISQATSAVFKLAGVSAKTPEEFFGKKVKALRAMSKIPTLK